MDHVDLNTQTPLQDSGRPLGGRVLVIEPDHLTMWSLSTYLQQWFTVETTHCGVEAEKLLRDHAVAGLIVSDRLPGRTAEALAQLAARRNPHVRTVLMVTGEADPAGIAWCATRIEKPFALSDLARLLGAPEENSAP